MAFGKGDQHHGNKTACRTSHDEQGGVIEPLNAPDLVVRITVRIGQKQGQRDEESVKSTDVRRVAQPQRQSGKAPGKGRAEQRILLVGGQGFHLGGPRFVGWHVFGFMELVLKIGVVFRRKDSFFPSKKRNQRTFNFHRIFVFQPRTLEQTRVLALSFTGMFNGVRDIVHRIPEGDGLIDERQMAR